MTLAEKLSLVRQSKGKATTSATESAPSSTTATTPPPPPASITEGVVSDLPTSLPLVILDEPIRVHVLIEMSMGSEAEGQMGEKMKARVEYEGDSSNPPGGIRQKVPTWRPQQKVRVDASFYGDWEDFPIDLYHGFKLLAGNPRYEGTSMETLLLIQGQQIGHVNFYSILVHHFFMLKPFRTDILIFIRMPMPPTPA